jgi:hypothetical protein
VLEVAEISHDLRNSHGAGIVDYGKLSANVFHHGLLVVEGVVAEEARDKKMGKPYDRRT